MLSQPPRTYLADMRRESNSQERQSYIYFGTGGENRTPVFGFGIQGNTIIRPLYEIVFVDLSDVLIRQTAGLTTLYHTPT